MSGWIFFAETATKAVSGFRNIKEQNGVNISITGMLIVFVVLSLISVLLTALPHVVAKLDEIFPPVQHHTPLEARASSNNEEETALAAIGFVLHTQVAQTRD
jgi:Na+-transporting methylmalonyl-CoA/oxaloacetate decarboxylase gamma subunit